ncbi:hypothetical protein OAL36_01310 [Akkermansiaceae bacterium]|jgi:hypothetical protein|nr:hypothetical protein [Verrucomicrobiota bacterium]MDA7651934.1 hypothetical protein [Akkermansiaceae bacterium]MDC0258412.1 hypothetical protein [bacterium]MDA7663398.1 hypothetical protein [Akkermansiaceae bacterium]MDB4723936.1 hypothetical protein [Akkermansiaceae bacterium]
MRRFIPVRTHILLISLVLLGHIKVLLADDNTGQKLARQPIAFKAPTLDSKPLKIGSRRELFVDNYILGSLRGSAKRRLFAMTPATNKTTDVAMTHDADWEGPWCRYAKYIQDNGVIKAWYMGHHTYGWNKNMKIAGGRLCYAISKDGHTFEKPNLGIYDWIGSKKNNVLFDDTTFKAKDSGDWIATHQFNPFIDTNPAAPKAARYKGFSGQGHHCGKTGLYAYQSIDGIHWEIASDGPIVSNDYSLDSCNQGFWDAERKRYAVYFRHLRNESGESGIKAPGWKRDILVTFSKDFMNWTEPQWLIYHRDDGRPSTELEHLYTNEVKPYKRAPHIYLGFPAQFNGSVDPMLMASRDGLHFYRWMEHPVIPKSAPADRQKIRSNHLWQEMVELPDEPNKLSMYASENLGIKGPHEDGSFPRVRRFTIRKDGFVSVRAGAELGELVTKPLIFTGNKLTVNYNAQLGEAGKIRIEVLDGKKQPISSFALKDCNPLSDDDIDAVVTWKGGDDLSNLAGKPIHLRFVLNQADLFSFRFTE